MTRLLLATDAVGGVWVYSLELARALRSFGMETILAVMGPAPNAQQYADAAGFELIDTGLPLDWLDTSPFEIRRAGEALAKLATGAGADVVQTSSAILLAEASFDQPCVALQHSCVASWWQAVRRSALPDKFAWRRDLIEAGLHRADAVVAPSIAFAAETSRLYGVAASYVHNGRAQAWTSYSPAGDFVFTAGRLWDEGKDVATLDRAAARIGVPFRAAGPVTGPNGARVELKNAQTLGVIGEARLRELYAARPIYVSAAVYEPFGLSVLEAAQAGCALVLTDIPTYRELWGGAAIFVAPGDDVAFAGAINDLLADSDERAQLGQLARARAAHYTPERMAEGMAAIYARLTPAALPVQLAGAA